MVRRTLMEKLQTLRTTLGVPLILNSVYRCEEYNKSVGSNNKSDHRRGLGADVRFWGTPFTGAQLEARALLLGFNAIGRYPDDGFIHLGIRRPKKDGSIFQWGKWYTNGIME